MSTQEKTCVLVVGGGPAGSTAATLLAQQNIEVILLEQAYFPRYHIGESLLSSAMYTLELSGAKAKVEAHGFIRKEGGLIDWANDTWGFHFTNVAGPRRSGYSFQVIRSEFDQILLEHAKSQGVMVREGIKATGISFDGERPQRATWTKPDSGQQGEITFDYLIDASGRAGVLTSSLDNRTYHELFKNVALWGYWTGAKHPEILPDAPKGSLATCSINDGWLWAIPLHDGTLSLGLVIHKEILKQRRASGLSLEQIYHQAISESQIVAGLVSEATLVTKLKTEQDYSYVTRSFSGPGYFLCGDAACFLDPLLSTGVHLATMSGLLAAASIASIVKGEVTEEEALTFYHQSYYHAYTRFFALLTTFYHYHIGKEVYFREAIRLTNHDYTGAELIAAFSHLVSGNADLQDIQGSKWVQATSFFADTQAAAAHGLYVRRKPLGLERISVKTL